MSTPETFTESLVDQLAHQLDEETTFMSGGFGRLAWVHAVVERGEEALPVLLRDMEQPSWWRLEAIWTIAHNAGKPIPYPEEIRGRHTEIRDFTIEWAKAQGYLSDIVDE